MAIRIDEFSDATDIASGAIDTTEAVRFATFGFDLDLNDFVYTSSRRRRSSIDYYYYFGGRNGIKSTDDKGTSSNIN